MTCETCGLAQQQSFLTRFTRGKEGLGLHPLDPLLAHIPPIAVICQVLILMTHTGIEGRVNLLTIVSRIAKNLIS